MAVMKIGSHGLAVVKAFESCLKPVAGRPGYFRAYVDPVGVLTIGRGHTNHHQPYFTPSTVWSQDECDAALAGDMATFEEHVNRLAKVPLAQHEFDALVSWAFNTGGPASASLWRLLNAGNKADIPANLAQWDKGTVGGKKVALAGLTRRRKAEGLLFAGKISDAYQVAQIKYEQSAWPTDQFSTQEQKRPVLRRGAKGAAVELMQSLLSRKGSVILRIDGDFGGKTMDALKEWQRGHGLVANGVCDQQSWLSLLD